MEIEVPCDPGNSSPKSRRSIIGNARVRRENPVDVRAGAVDAGNPWHIKDICNVEISPELVSWVTDEVKGLVDEWRSRPLEPLYPAVVFDALWVNTALRRKEALGMWVERNGARSSGLEYCRDRRAIYTTNAVESLNFTLQRNLKIRLSFLGDGVAMKLIFMILRRILKRWAMPIRDCGLAMLQFAVICGGGVPL